MDMDPPKISGSISLKENEIDDDIEETLKLLPINQIQYETHEVLVKTKVKRFTEKSVEAFINIKNLPDSLAIKLFPQSINITFLVLIEKQTSFQQEISSSVAIMIKPK